ncbi:MAG: ATP-grasp domain-containing protein [Chitinophagaceae bacterium]|nr:ATP-grasp domain-containing protein [Oligoflexus sp.]
MSTQERKKEAVYLIIEPYHDYGLELMRAAFEDFGLRCIILVEDFYDALHKKDYCAPIPTEWLAEQYHCPKDRALWVAQHIQKRFDIVAIIPWSEQSLELAMIFLKVLPIDWVKPETLARFRNKYDLKSYLRLHHPHIPMNASWFVQHAEDVEKLRASLPPKFVIKPIDGVGNQQVGFFSRDQPEVSVVNYFLASGLGRYVLEEFIEGTEYAVNGQTNEKGDVIVYSVLRYYHRHANGRPNVYTRSMHVPRSDPDFRVLTAYSESVVKALGLHRCPFHAEIRLDPEKGPCLVEIAARPVGNQLVILMRDAHGFAFDPLRIAVHYYLSEKPLDNCSLDWPRYDRTQALNVDGITDQSGLITAISGIEGIDHHASFRRWVSKPKVGRLIKATQDLPSQPYSFHLASQEADVDLLQDADRLESQLIIKTHGVDNSLRVKALILNITRRIVFKFKWLNFRLSMR